MTSATLGNTVTGYLGKYMVNSTAYLLTYAVAAYTSVDTLSNHTKVTSTKHCGFARDVQTTTYHLSSTKRRLSSEN